MITTESLAPDIPQHLAFYQGWRPGHITDRRFVAVYLEQSCQLAGLDMVRDKDDDGRPVPNPVVSRAHKFGLCGLAHISTSMMDFMGWDKPGPPPWYTDRTPAPWSYFTLMWYTCGDVPCWEDLVVHADEYFGVRADAAGMDRSWTRMLPELSAPARPRLRTVLPGSVVGRL
jgi:hypothetical protein